MPWYRLSKPAIAPSPHLLNFFYYLADPLFQSCVHLILRRTAGPYLSQGGLRLHFKQVVKHAFERCEGAATSRGPRIPLWKHVNITKDMLFGPAVSKAGLKDSNTNGVILRCRSGTRLAAQMHSWQV